MAETKKPKKSDYKGLHKGTHKQRKEKGDILFSWAYECRRDRKLSRIIIQQFEIVDGERKSKGDKIIFADIFCVLTRNQVRDFVRNYKK